MYRCMDCGLVGELGNPGDGTAFEVVVSHPRESPSE